MEERRPEYDDLGDFPAKWAKDERISDDADEDSPAGFSIIDEQMLVEVMKVLEKEISCQTTTNPSLTFPSPFVTTSCNEESCGPSFSDFASTVMASIDTCGVSFSYLMGPTVGDDGGSKGFPVAREVPSKGTGSSDVVDQVDDEWVERLLEETLFEFEEY